MTSLSKPDSFLLAKTDLALATDLYQLTMTAAYHALELETGEAPRGTFELFVRRLPPGRSFLVFAGLEQALASIQALRFTGAHLDYLRSLAPFASRPASFFEALEAYRFRGEISAMEEGTIFFPEEPVLQVTGTLFEAQLLETLVLAIIDFQTAVASKAARMRLAAGPERSLADFGTRRAHGPLSGAWVARAAYLAGFEATSNVWAGQRLGIPVVGTMAHSYVLSFDGEEEAFRHYQETFPDHTILLVDTYDTVAAVEKAVQMGIPFSGVRLDSGDLGGLAKRVRAVLDGAGRQEVKIYASGDLDEHGIEELLREGAPIDSFGVGTRLAAVSDAPYLSGVYKLVEIDRNGEPQPRAKESSGKPSRPWRKQVYRRWEEGKMAEDLVQRAVETAPDEPWQPLLKPVMRDGELLTSPDLEAARERCARGLEELPDAAKGLDGDEVLPVRQEIPPGQPSK